MRESNTVERWPMYIGGKPRQTPQVRDVVDPGTNTVVASVSLGHRDDALEAVRVAEKGAVTAAHMPAHEKMRILRDCSELVLKESEGLADLITQESSKTIREARKEVMRCIDTLRLSAEEARRIAGEVIRFDQAEGSESRIGYWDRGPVGIVTAITPFNDPLNLVAHKVGPAIAGGNAVILKPSNETPLSALRFAHLLYEAGLPGDMLSVITGDARDIGETIISHPAVRMVSFTGGLKTGLTITRQAGLKKLSMELGSNSPVIILSDADLERAVEATVTGTFWAAGQNCLGVQRIFVENRVYDEVKERLVARTEMIRTGDKRLETTDMGPLINEREVLRVESWVQDVINRGGQILTGGYRDGNFYAPTLLDRVPHGAVVLEEEVFGPVACLIPVPNLTSAIAQANNVNYGLQAGVFTRDIQQAFTAVRELQVGGVMINDSSDYRIDAMPFGGVKGSGIGREGVRFTVESMTEPKVVCINL